MLKWKKHKKELIVDKKIDIRRPTDEGPHIPVCKLSQLILKMSLAKFSLPGKDCRCILFDGKVCKIKTLMPPLKDGDIKEYIDDKTLQEEIEDIIRAVLCIPHNVNPVLMRTEHLFVNPEKKEWKLPSKVEFKVEDQSCSVLPFMYILNLQLHAAKKETSKHVHIQEVTEGMEISVDSKKRKVEGSSSPPKPTTQSKRPKRHISVERQTSSSSPPRRSNRRMAPSLGSDSSSAKPRYVLRRRALRMSTSNHNNNSSTVQRGEMAFERHSRCPFILSDDVEIDEEVMLDSGEGLTDRKERWTHRRNRIEVEREASPELESGFSRLMKGKAALGPERYPRVNECGDSDNNLLECTGDQGPMPVQPSRGAARVMSVPGHPGRERVEQHVLQEQLRLQEMASPRPDTKPEDQYRDEDRGMVHRMFDAVVTPVKKLFSRE